MCFFPSYYSVRDGLVRAILRRLSHFYTFPIFPLSVDIAPLQSPPKCNLINVFDEFVNDSCIIATFILKKEFSTQHTYIYAS